MKNVIILAAAALALAACSDAPGAERVLRQNGYTNVQTNGHAFFSCGERDSFATSFTAISPSGQKASGAVCSGFLKGSTIRFN